MTTHKTTNIQTLKELQAAIQTTKKEIKISEVALQNCWEKLPTEIVKATVGKVVPAMFNRSIANKTFEIGIALVQQLLTNTSNSVVKQTIISAAKYVGISTLSKTLFRYFLKS